MKFLQTIIRAIAPKTKREAEHCRRELLANPAYHSEAREHGNAKRRLAHRRSCLQAYAAKRAMVGKGRNSVAGIPV